MTQVKKNKSQINILHYLESKRYKFALLWFFLVVVFLTRSILNPLEIRTNLSDLFISSSQQSLISKFNASLLNQNSEKLMFVIEGVDFESIKTSSKLLIERIELSTDYKLKFIDSNQVLNEKLKQNKDKIYGLIGEDQRELLKTKNSLSLVEQNIIKNLSSPLSSFYSIFLEYDPLLLFPKSLLRSREGFPGEFSEYGLLNNKNNKFSLTIFANLDNTQIKKDEEILVFKKIENVVHQIKESFPAQEIVWTGFSKFAATSKQKIESEIKLYTNISIILVSGIIIFCFRSIKPLILTGLAVTVGILSGYIFIGLHQNSIHLMTIGFGSCLLGASVDYSLHYLTHVSVCREKNLSYKVLKPITFGVFTTVMSFVSLMLSDFPGLKELSLFAIGSLIGSYATVLLIFPIIPTKWLIGSSSPSNLSVKLNKYLVRIFISKTGKTIFSLSVLLFVFWGLKKLEFNDDIRLFQPKNKLLVEEVVWINERNNIAIPKSYLLLNEGLTSIVRTKLYEALFKLKKDGKISGFVENDPFRRSKKEAKESFDDLYTFYVKNISEIDSMFKKIGIEEGIIQSFYRNLNAYRTDSDLANVLPPNAITLYGIKNESEFKFELRDLLTDSIVYYNQVEEVSDMFKTYRIASIKLIAGAYVFIFLFLSYVYGIKNGLLSVISSLLGGFMALGTMGLFGMPINFFSILAIIIVLGIGIDFAIFLNEKKITNDPSQLSVFLSVVSTVITFGLFSLSSAPILQSLSAIISLGVMFSYCSANILIFNRNRDE